MLSNNANQNQQQTIISQQQLTNLNDLVTSLKKEVLLLRDEVRVKDQMIVSTANMLHRANEELMQLRSSQKVQKAAEEGADELSTKVAALEAKILEKDKVMADWKSKVKDAIKENKRKEKIAEDEIATLRNQTKDLQSQCRELQYLKKTRDVEKTDQEAQTVGNFLFSAGGGSGGASGSGGVGGGQQSDFLNVEQRLGSAGTSELQYWIKHVEKSQQNNGDNNYNNNHQQDRAGSGNRPLTVILTPPSRLTLRRTSMSNTSRRGSTSVTATGTAGGIRRNSSVQEQQEQQPFSPEYLVSPNSQLLASPPPQIPEMSQKELKNAPPIIVSIFYGTADGWSVDTKLRVEAGQTVSDLIEITCEKINQRYEKHLHSENMCLRTHHPRAQRWVTMKDHRSVHSFAFFLRSATQQESIKLQLEQLSAVDLARKQVKSLSMQREMESVSRQLEDD